MSANEIKDLEEQIRLKKTELLNCSSSSYTLSIVITTIIGAIGVIFGLAFLAASIIEIYAGIANDRLNSAALIFFSVCLALSLLCVFIAAIMNAKNTKKRQEEIKRKNDLSMDIKFMEARLSALYMKEK